MSDRTLRFGRIVLPAPLLNDGVRYWYKNLRGSPTPRRRCSLRLDRCTCRMVSRSCFFTLVVVCSIPASSAPLLPRAVIDDQVVALCPRYVVVNAMKRAIEVQQAGFDGDIPSLKVANAPSTFTDCTARVWYEYCSFRGTGRDGTGRDGSGWDRTGRVGTGTGRDGCNNLRQKCHCHTCHCLGCRGYRRHCCFCHYCTTVVRFVLPLAGLPTLCIE